MRTVRSDRHRAEIRDELQFHLEMEATDGFDRRDARLRLGNVSSLEEQVRSVGIVQWLDSALGDVRFGLRQLRRTPALALAVTASLAIGVGANTAIFSLVDAAILKPLPVRDPASLRIVEWTNSDFPVGATNINGDFEPIAGGRHQGSSVAAHLYRRLAHDQHAFDALMGIADPEAVAVSIDGSPAEQVSLQFVSANFFQGIGAPTILGRPFQDQDDQVGAEPVVVVSHRFWRTHLGGSRDTLDRAARINSVPVRIVGVAPAGFFGLAAGQWTDVYAPLAAKVALFPRSSGESRHEDETDWWVRQIGRLRPGVPEPEARTQIAGIFRSIAVPEGASPDPDKIPELVTLPGRHGFDWALNRRDASALWILTWLVGVLLLIVCANVANLLLARSVGRHRESAVRLALGASRGRLFRQHAIESALFALLGGGVGLASGYLLARIVHQLFQSGRTDSSAYALDIDLRVLMYTAALSALTALLVGLAPAVRAAHADLADSLKAQTRSVLGGRLRLPRLLVSTQIALCLAALVAAGLLGRSLENLRSMDVGFDRENVAYASVSPSRAGYDAARIGPYVDRVLRELSALPGVVKVSPVRTRLLSGGGNASLVNIPGRPIRLEGGTPNPDDWSQINGVGSGFFDALRIPVVAGRALDDRDMRSPADSGAVVVDEVFAHHFFPHENPLGKRFGLGLDLKRNTRFEIVGVVGNTRYNNMRGDASPTVYQAYRSGGTVHFAIRTAGDPRGLAAAVRKAIAAVDPAVPLTEFHTQRALIDRLLRSERLLGFLSGAFGVVSLTLAAVGLAGLLGYAVARRTTEIGVRMALGAGKMDVLRLVLLDSVRVVGVGLLVGLPCAFMIARLLQSALFQLEPIDPLTTAGSFAVLLSVALIAAWIPARRAASIDPMRALREE
ncbi:MAG TPA: ABC transporter permease [Vicinamibacterales bacterium]